jgi:hypothetical protein
MQPNSKAIVTWVKVSIRLFMSTGARWEAAAEDIEQ